MKVVRFDRTGDARMDTKLSLKLKAAVKNIP